MAKIITLPEIIDALKRHSENIGEDEGIALADDLADVLTKHCGGNCSTATPGLPDELGICVAFHFNEDVPPDGGIYMKYDTDITLQDWKEEYDLGKLAGICTERKGYTPRRY